MKLAELAHLPTLDGHQTAELLGCSYWSLLEQVKRGDCPVVPLRLGRKYRWPTAAVLRLLGIDPLNDERLPAQGAPATALTALARQNGGGGD